MKLKTRLNINAAISVMTAIVIVMMLFMALYRVSRAIEESNIAGELMATAFERSILKSDYLRTNSEKSKEQWLDRHSQMRRLLNFALEKFGKSEDKKLIKEMLKDLEFAGENFLGIVENREKRKFDADSAGLSQETEDRLVSQLEKNLYDKILNLNTMHEAAGRRLWSALRLAGGVIISSIAILAVAVIVNSWTMGRALASRIGRLRDGVSVIGGGDLDHRVGIEGNDELAELSGAFNAMTAKLRRSYSDLEKEIADRMQVEEALREAKEASETANRAKSQFLANMSHELRTPMNTFLGVLQLLLGGNVGPLETKQRELLEMADKSGHFLLQVISDILDLSKIEAGKLPIMEKPFPLRACFSSTIGLFAADAQQKGLDLTFAVAPDVPDTLIGDFLRLRQVLINLVGNAIKFTERGSIEVKVAAGSEIAAGKREFVFVVTDSGIGIPADKKHLLFSPFSQADDSNTRSYGGTGLGLAISRQIVGMMGGTISFESTEGLGSTFSFTVPLGEGVEEAGTVPEAPTPVAVAPPPVIEVERKPLILVAEDDMMASDLIKEILALRGFETELARTGQEAVDMWEKGRYDLIIMDIQMPRLDGISATRIIREKEKTTDGHIPIVAMTAHAFSEDKERCLAAGMDAYLTKPLEINKGMEVIMSLLRK